MLTGSLVSDRPVPGGWMQAFRLDPQREIPAEVQRLLAHGIDHAIAALLGPDRVRGSHQALETIERCRAVLGLVRSDLRASERRPLERALRDAARHLRPFCEAERVRSRSRPAGDLREIVWHAELAPEQVDAGLCVARAREELERARGALAGLHVGKVGRKSLVRGFRRSWRAARQAVSEAGSTPDAEMVEAWRRAVRRLHHHVLLLSPLWPALAGVLAQELDTLQELLSEHHELALVCEAVDRERTPPEVTAALEHSTSRRARELGESALRIGRRLFAIRPRQAADLLEAVWGARES